MSIKFVIEDPLTPQLKKHNVVSSPGWRSLGKKGETAKELKKENLDGNSNASPNKIIEGLEFCLAVRAKEINGR